MKAFFIGFRAISIGVVLCLTACAHLGTEGAATVAIGGGASVILPRSPDAGRAISAIQLAVLHHDGRSFAFNVRLRGNAKEFHMVALDGMGRRAFAVTWRDTGLDIQRAPWLPDSVPAENILADMFLIYWPRDTVRNAIRAPIGAIAMDNNHRSITVDGTEMLLIEYDGGEAAAISGRVQYRNTGLDYRINITSTGIPG